MQDVLAEIEKAGDAANDAWLKDPNGPVQQRVAAAIAKLGENMAVPRFVRYAGQGYVGQYIHLGGKIGVQVEFGGVTPAMAGREEFTTLVKEIAMQIAAASPAYVVARRRPGRRRSRRRRRSTAPRWRTPASRPTSSTRSSKASSGASTRRSCCPTSRRSAIRR